IGACDQPRISRHTSAPEPSGSPRSSTIRSGRSAAAMSMPSRAVAASRTRVASSASAWFTTRRIWGSSSTTRTVFRTEGMLKGSAFRERLPRGYISPMSVEATLVVLFSVATAVAIGARRLRVSYTPALVVVGVRPSALHVVEPPHLTKQVLFAFILPGLLFEAAFNLDLGELRRNWWGITALAVPGVVVSIAFTAWITTTTMSALGVDREFTMGLGLVFGALIAATDPVAVVALFKQLRAPARLTTMLEAESLLNDGTAIVFLTLILTFVSGASTTPGSIAWHF